MENLCKIVEGDVEYEIGRIKGKTVIYDFPKILVFLEAKGKQLFGDRFKIGKTDKAILLVLCNYFVKDLENCEKDGIDPSKGILLTGPVGCGKTSLMKLLKHLPQQRNYEVMPCRNIVFAFNHLGFKTVQDYGDSGFFCFDDLGVEPMGRYYAQDCNVIGEILLSRHELFLNTGVKTHATTNLNAEELEDRYGQRVRSRMRELFNLIAYEKHTKDKRQ